MAELRTTITTSQFVTGPQSPSRIAAARRLGAALGLGVGALFAVAAAPFFTGPASMGVTDYVVMLAVPTLATGFLCGWLLGPRGARAQEGIDKGGVALRMAVLATAIGDYLVGVAMGTPSADGTDQLLQRLVQGLASAVWLWPIGLLLFGFIALPITFFAGLVWAWLMGLLGRSQA